MADAMKSSKVWDRSTISAISVLAIGLLWSFWPTLRELVEKWSSNSQYSYGFLVPVLAAGLLWVNRSRLRGMAIGANLWGLPLLALAAALRLGGAYFFYQWFEQISVIVFLAGACLFMGGWRFFAWCAPALCLLAFMIPLPYRFETAMSGPLQRVATISSAYLLQTIGHPAVPRGNTINMGQFRLDVERACSGLRMLLSFMTLSCAVALFVQRTWWQRLAIFASSVPIALACNVIRIVMTGMLLPLVGGERAKVFFHDVSGLLMMPLALGMLLAELYLFSRLIVEVDLSAPTPLMGARRREPAAAGFKG